MITSARERPLISGLRVLVVDADPVICETVAAMLVAAHHLPKTALSAREALKKFDSDDFHVVLVDYDLLTTKGGRLARAVKSRVQPKPLILMSACGPTHRPKHIDVVLSKPFTLLQLWSAIYHVSTGR